jgi:hypothetical protein
MPVNYANTAQADQSGLIGGYKSSLFFAKVADILTWGRPLAAALGDAAKIVTAHVFVAAKCAFLMEAKLHSSTIKGTSVGDEGAQDMEWTAEVKILGDNPILQDQLLRMQNDQIVIWLKDADCLTNDSYIQMGDDCVPVTVKIDFDGKTTKDGKKEYTLTLTSKKKFHYLATLDVTP